MEEKDSLYPWFIFLFFILSYLLRAIRASKKKKQERKEEQERRRILQPHPPPPKREEKKPPTTSVIKKEPLEPVFPSKEPLLLPKKAPIGKRDIKTLIRQLPSNRSLIVLSEVINRPDFF